MKKTAIIIAGVFFLLLLLAGAGIYTILFAENGQAASEKTAVFIKRGMGVNQIAKILADKHLVSRPGAFKLGAKILGVSNELQAGRYEIASGLRNYDILTMLSQGRVSSIRVTIPEGLTARLVASILADSLGIDSSRVVSLAQDSSFAATLGVASGSLEGFLFPDTYDFFWRQDEAALLTRMVERFQAVLPDSIADAMTDHKMRREALTLASIIQGEAMLVDEMPVISAVYHNRLKKRMRLQADPTLQYIISGPPRRLTNRDKEIDSPYNTYRHGGLPPGPINSPGLAAIAAALNPADVPYLYFVANGDGSHSFSRTFAEHLRAKARFDRLRREHDKKRRAANE